MHTSHISRLNVTGRVLTCTGSDKSFPDPEHHNSGQGMHDGHKEEEQLNVEEL